MNEKSGHGTISANRKRAPFSGGMRLCSLQRNLLRGSQFRRPGLKKKLGNARVSATPIQSQLFASGSMFVFIGRPFKHGCSGRKLDNSSMRVHILMSQRCFSTNQVAQKLRINQANFQRLIRHKRIPFPPLVQVAGLKIRLWTKTQVERARKALAKRREKRG